MDGKRIRFLTKTAVLLALLVGLQFVTRPLGQFVTGAAVNMVLFVSVFVVGTGCGMAVGVLSNFLAVLVGIGPAFIQITPFVAVSNVIMVGIAQLIRSRTAREGDNSRRAAVFTALSVVAAGASKTAFLWIGLVKIALPLIQSITGMNEKQLSVISASFTWPQMVTAVIGGALAMAIVPVLKKAVKKR